MTIVPKFFGRLKTFRAREVVDLIDNRWVRNAAMSDPTLDEMVEAWRSDTASQLLRAESPHVSLYSSSDTRQLLLLTLSVLYLPAVEGIYDQTQQTIVGDGTSSRTGSDLGGLASQADAESEADTDIYQPVGP